MALSLSCCTSSHAAGPFQAEKDWQGQLRALRAVEPLVRAAPDELEHYAGGLGQGRKVGRVGGMGGA